MSDSWSAPIPLSTHNKPPFPVKALPRAIRDYVKELSEALQVPCDLPAMLALAVVAATTAKKIVVSPRPGWVEPTNLYVVVTLPPAERKSAVFREITAPLEDAEREYVMRMHSEYEEACQSRRIKESALKRAEDEASRAVPEKAKAAMLRAVDLRKQLPNIPTQPRLLADDVSPEQLSSLIVENDGRIALMSPEGGVFDMIAGRYSGTPNLDVYLKAHSGDAIRVDRVGRDSQHVNSPALTMGLAIQPDVIRGFVNQPRFRGRGLIGRFLYSLPQSKVGRRSLTAKPISSEVKDAYTKTIRALLEFNSICGRINSPEPMVLTLNQGAYVCFLDFGEEIERSLAPGGQFEYARDWAGKLHGTIARIAGILHVIENHNNLNKKEISEQTMMSAILIGCYLREHALAALDLMGADPTVDDARHILEWIEREKFGKFSAREAHQAMKGRFKRRKLIDPALKMLVDHGYLIYAPKPEYSGPGRKPSAAFIVNPLHIARYSQYAQKGTTKYKSEDIENTVTGHGSIRSVI